jgi:hypothetical protein
MRRTQVRDFWCPVVSEAVTVRLTRPASLSRQADYFVRCSEADCQYVDANAPPCPLHAGMFSEEIKAIEAARTTRSGDGSRD